MPKRQVYPPSESTYATGGCWMVLVILAIGGWLFANRWPSRSWVAVLLTAPLGFLLWSQLSMWSTIRAARLWRRQGRIGLLVYSRSPNWQTHIEQEWLPRY